MITNIKHLIILQAIATGLDEEEKKGVRALDELYECLQKRLQAENIFPDAASLRTKALELVEEGFLDFQGGWVRLTFMGYLKLTNSELMSFLQKKIPEETRKKLEAQSPFKTGGMKT